MSTPASMGPAARATLNCTEFSVIAFWRKLRGTSSGTIDCHAGTLSAIKIPPASDTKKSAQYEARSASQSPQRTNACTIRSVCVTSSRRRRGNRSASAPPTAPSSSSGTTVMNAISVTFAALRVATATTQSSAASCMLFPMLDPTAPVQKTRKSWNASARTDRGSGRVRSGSSAGASASKVAPDTGLPGPHVRDLHGLGVPTRAEEGAGTISREHASGRDLGPVDEHVLDALGLGVQPARARGQVMAGVDGPGRDAVLVEQHEVGVPALGDPAAIADAVETRLDVGEQVDGLLERQQLIGPAGCEERRGVAERREHVEVRAGVGRAHDDARIAPRFGPQPPRLGVVASRRGREHGPEVVGDDDVEQRVERFGALLGRDVGDRPAGEAFVLGCEGLADPESVPTQ